jgi:hypothetical protein
VGIRGFGCITRCVRVSPLHRCHGWSPGTRPWCLRCNVLFGRGCVCCPFSSFVLLHPLSPPPPPPPPEFLVSVCGRGGVVRMYPSPHLCGVSSLGPLSSVLLQDPGKVFKGKKMPGRMGFKRITVEGLKVRRPNHSPLCIALYLFLDAADGFISGVPVCLCAGLAGSGLAGKHCESLASETPHSTTTAPTSLSVALLKTPPPSPTDGCRHP